MNHIENTETCWNWKSYKDSKGYGQTNKGSLKITAHRFPYELFKIEIHSNLSVCHSCDNPSCVNPDHLWLGTKLCKKYGITVGHLSNIVNRRIWKHI